MNIEQFLVKYTPAPAPVGTTVSYCRQTVLTGFIPGQTTLTRNLTLTVRTVFLIEDIVEPTDIMSID